ncbi:YwqG family protein [Micromonospora zamorensis]|uniref:YwqG family protein n=1 Tax=Micromonospora zamorensis TaxID=709883 RepID=A0ABZ1PPM9_9ACTN
MPELPPDLPWPAGLRGPLPFVASFDCATLPKVDGLALPPDGTLLIFLDHESAYDTCDRDEEQQYARIVHVPAGTDSVVTDPPDDAPERPSHTQRTFVGPESDLFAIVHAAVPHWLNNDEDREYENGLSDFQARVARTLPHRKELCTLTGELWPDGSSPAFQFSGYSGDIGEMATDHLFTTPELTIAEENLKAWHEDGESGLSPEQEDLLLEEELQQVEKAWIPLVQFTPGDDVYRGRFLIRQENLAARRFDRAVSWTAFTE